MRSVIFLMAFLFLGLTSSFQIIKLDQNLIDETDGKYKTKKLLCKSMKDFSLGFK